MSGLDIGTLGLGKKPVRDLSLRNLASHVINLSLVDLLDEEGRPDANEFFYSIDLDFWCRYLDIDADSVREALEELGLISERDFLVPNITIADIMQYYLEAEEYSNSCNPEVLLEVSSRYGLPYSLIHHYVYKHIFPFKKGHMETDLGKRFFDTWKKRKSTHKGRGPQARFGKVLEAFRKKLREKG